MGTRKGPRPRSSQAITGGNGPTGFEKKKERNPERCRKKENDRHGRASLGDKRTLGRIREEKEIGGGSVGEKPGVGGKKFAGVNINAIETQKKPVCPERRKQEN